MADHTAEPRLSQSHILEHQSSSDKKAVVGIYGVPGSGKTYLLKQLQEKLGQEDFSFYDGSEIIADLVPGRLNAFQKLGDEEKAHWRKLAIEKIGRECAERGRVAVVAGHFMFWPEEDEDGLTVWTKGDAETFTHILYLDVPSYVVEQRRRDDKERRRPPATSKHLQKWQQAERVKLHLLCCDHGILFSPISPNSKFLDSVITLLHDFSVHSEQHNLAYALRKLEETVVTGKGNLETVLVMDGDKTLTEDDTGTLFWQRAFDSQWSKGKDYTLEKIFSGPSGYSYTAFRQAMLLYEEFFNGSEFDSLCYQVASRVTIYPEFLKLLKFSGIGAAEATVGAVIVTCGLRQVWERVLEMWGLSDMVKVIGGGRIADGFVVTAEVKAALVDRLRDRHQLYVWAFGDSPLDIKMLKRADQAIVVVGEEQKRSKSMEIALEVAIEKDGLRACQAVLPPTASPRLDTDRLPLVDLTDPEFVQSILARRIQVVHATGRSSAKLMMTLMRDATVTGPALRDAHRRAGQYLATEYLADVLGLEEYQIPHVQGHPTNGHRLIYEDRTLIVALMRGGELMAFGVNDVYPRAAFVHAKSPGDIRQHHLQGRHAAMRTVVLVDSVINSGNTVVEFVKHIRDLDANCRVVVVAGVVYAPTVSSGGSLAKALVRHGPITVIALRLSSNSFTGSGTTDTGNRLFNTLQIP